MNKFSFIIPVYNCAEYLKDCVLGIERLGLPDYEIILVDDGSEDGSSNLCDELQKKSEQIWCIHQKNRGVSAARNRGIKVASGEYVLFFDADDTVETDRLRVLLENLDSTQDVDMIIFGLFLDYYHNGRCYRTDELKTPLDGMKKSIEWIPKLKNLYSANSLNPIWNKIFRRQFLIEHELYLREDMFLYEDLEFSIRCMAYCDKILFEPEGIYHYRQSEDEGNAGRRLKRIEHISEVAQEVEQALDDLIDCQDVQNQSSEIKNIILSLYLVLAREKISVSNARQIQRICRDFSGWFKERKLEPSVNDRVFVNQMLDQKVISLLRNRIYIKFRHKMAVKLKNTKIYQKIRG